MEAYLPSFYDKLSVKEQKSLMKKKLIKKLKGVPKAIVKKNIDVGHYTKCVLENEPHTEKDIISFRTKELSNYTIKQDKLALSNTDDRRVWQGLNSFAYGHYKLTV